jgi:DNA-binding GntR family transcriptional regulator
LSPVVGVQHTEGLGALERAETLGERVYQVIRAAIIDGRIASGSPVAEPALAKELGVSRTPVREALRKLDEVGLVSLQPGGRAVVVTLSENSLRETYELREALEGMAARLAAQRIGDAAGEQIERAARASLDAAQAGDDAGFRAHDADFHTRVSTAAGNDRLARYLNNARDLAGALRQIDAPAPGYAEACGHAHLATADAIRSHHPERAEAAMRAHIQAVLDHVLDYKQRTQNGG